MRERRTDGFYHVKLAGVWIVGKWEDWGEYDPVGFQQIDGVLGAWYICGNELMFSDEEFDKIDITPIIKA